MNYYEHHLGDWAAATGHLSWDEDMAYTRLLRAYYHAEKAIPQGQQYRLAKAGTPAQRKAVDTVLAEFFSLEADGCFHQKRADAEIARYLDKQAKAKRSAEARWNPQSQHTERNANASPNAMRTHSEGNALQTPDTRHQTETPPNPRKRGQVSEFPPGFDAFWSAYPRKQAKPAAAKAFARVRADEALLARMLSAIAQQSASEQWTKDGGQFIPLPASWLNGRRWEDAPLLAASGSDIFAGAE